MTRPVGWKLSDRAEHVLEDLIRRGELRIGDQLPSERKLVDRFGVSRTVVREAINRLASRGVLRIESGRGAYVVATPESALAGSWQSWVGADGAKVLAILEVRMNLEVPGAAWAAERASVAQRDALMEAHASFRSLAAGEAGAIALSAADRLFHYRLAECTGNDMLMRIVHDINEILALGRRSSFVRPDSATRSLVDHERIVDAFVRGDATQTSRAMRAHLRRVTTEMERTLAAGMSIL